MSATTIFTAACVQLNSGNNLQVNLEKAGALIFAAAAAGAQFIALPESAFFMGANFAETFANASQMHSHSALKYLQKLAKELEIWLLFGISVKNGDSKKLRNRSVLLNPQGEVVDFYDKIHLFDVDVPYGESHRESDNFEPGERAVLVDLPWAKLGMTICYDLRFPSLFRELAQAGAQIIAVPSAFTHKTGTAHWHTLLRARAIETASYIIAPAQCGHHPRGRQTYGHSLIIDPWGEIIAEASENNEEFIVAEFDLALVSKIRSSLPSLKHDKKFKIY